MRLFKQISFFIFFLFFNLFYFVQAKKLSSYGFNNFKKLHNTLNTYQESFNEGLKVANVNKMNVYKSKRLDKFLNKLIKDFTNVLYKKIKQELNWTNEYVYIAAKIFKKNVFEKKKEIKKFLRLNFSDFESRNLFAQKIDINDNNHSLIAVGDLHGSYPEFYRVLLNWLKNGVIDDQLRLSENITIVFTGDYIDRGWFGLDIFIFLMLLKVINPNSVFLLRGNHEIIDWAFDIKSDFRDELIKKIGISNGRILYYRFCCFFNLLPEVLYLKCNGTCWQVSHGGWEFITNYDPSLFLNSEKQFESINSLSGVLNGFFWNDISPFLLNEDWITGKTRGITFSANYVLEQIKKLDITGIIRGHDHEMPKKMDAYNKNRNIASVDDVDLNELLNYSIGCCNLGTVENPIFTLISSSIFVRLYNFYLINYKPSYLQINFDQDEWAWESVVCN